MTDHANIFACLVHESQDCVIDLVRNLRCLDPDSPIILYNGGHDKRLLNSGFPFHQYGAIVHPLPQPVPWGKLHPFALDCMTFALDHFPMRTLTIVDSDQLAMRPGYSAHLAAFLSGRTGVGMLGNSPGCQPPKTRISPAQTAHKEIDLWRPFLRRFPNGEQKFVCWSFWPSTVFTAEAARDLTQLFASDAMLRDIMTRSKIWASEEIILPTLVSLLGYQILASPCSYELVQYRKQYTLPQVKAAQAKSNSFWLHPVPRVYNDPLRSHLRSSFSNYESNGHVPEVAMSAPNSQPEEKLLLTWPILNRMKQVEGWLDEDEADLLIAATSLALSQVPEAQALVEVGSYCGRSTCVIGSVVKALRPAARFYAIDPHDGRVGSLDQGIKAMPPTLDKLKRNLNAAGVAEYVDILVATSSELEWNKPTCLIFIDGLHDYANVARDFYRFEPSLAVGGYAAFHDYADYFPGVKSFVNELLRTGRYEKVHRASSMIVLRKTAQGDPLHSHRSQPVAAVDSTHTFAVASRDFKTDCAATPGNPLVSCIMPTANRRSLVPQAIQYFLRQDYPNRELLILDDGDDAVADLIPRDERIRYMRLPHRHTIGAKRNIGCENARGELIAHWDDDDWIAGRRLSYQVNAIANAGGGVVSGLSSILYYQPPQRRAWLYVYPNSQRKWLAGNTLCYPKALWKQHRFQDINEGEDTRFVWGLPGKAVLPLTDHTFYLATVHEKNSSPKRTQDTRWHPHPVEDVESMLGADLHFYEAWPSALQIASHLHSPIR
jgi:hypothetical protein